MNLRLFSGHYWTEVTKRVKKAVVYLDKNVYRVLHFNGGISRLFQIGQCLKVKTFSRPSNAEVVIKKAVFLISSPLKESSVTLDRLRDIIQHSKFEYVQVITTYSFDDNDDYRNLERRILSWMGNLQYTCEIFHIPLCLVPLGENVMITPTFSNHLRTLDFENDFVSFFNSFLSLYNIKEDIFTIGSFSSVLGSRLESLPSAKNRRKTASNSASVIFIDRTVDIFTPTMNVFESVLDVLMETLSSYPDVEDDVTVNMESLFNTTVSSSCPPGALADSLRSVLDKEENYDPRNDLWNNLLYDSSTKFEAVVEKELRKIDRRDNQLVVNSTVSNFIERVEAMSEEDELSEDELTELTEDELSEDKLSSTSSKAKDNYDENHVCHESHNHHHEYAARKLKRIQRSVKKLNNKIIRDIKTASKPATTKLERILNEFKVNDEIIRRDQHVDLIQKAVAINQCLLKSSDVNKINVIMKQLQAQLITDIESSRPDAVFETLIDIMKTRREIGITLENALLLVIFGYTGISDITITYYPEAEDKLQSMFTDQILEIGNNLESESRTFARLCNGTVKMDELTAHRIVKIIFDKLKSLTALTKPKFRLDGSRKMFIEWFLEELYSESRISIPEMEVKSPSSLLRSGISLLGVSVNKTHPRENPVIIIYIVGGISPKEIKKAHDILRKKNAKAKFIFGSNRILTSKNSSLLLND